VDENVYKRKTKMQKGKLKKRQFDKSPDWIQCDDWLHDSFIGIVTEEQWKEYEPVDVNFFCPTCIK